MDDDLFISRSALAARLGHPDAPWVLDVRRAERFDGAAHRIASALRSLPDSARERDVVVYCVHGHEVSRDAALTLRASGRRAWALEGGIEGAEAGVDDPAFVARVRAQPLPLVRQRPDLGVCGDAPSCWITRARPKIDRIACPWLVRRFIDPLAQVDYVPADEVLSRAQATGAVAFDIAGGPISHVGDHCSFDALLEAFGLHTPALDRLAAIVRGADTGALDLAPACAGLLHVSLGLSRLHAMDDQAMLAAGMTVYDGLHAWCQSETAGTHESHVWSPA
ncbi:MAG: chromate resistance protein [Hydrogenophaga sp.]|uniref:chromate resistance protein ChrB domain-containing protein n=1 Tax=Hydrogenophaga sp. TaxID=1904254 RepID=UPI001D73DBF7|nr:chromate resistance protein ChrB domain-containing protein [Hydrogenophaga sp.]MBX3610661.1 chromate resistance protein [Hydrogenophaga sp.]